jgi:hypothetical protein
MRDFIPIQFLEYFPASDCPYHSREEIAANNEGICFIAFHKRFYQAALLQQLGQIHFLNV